MTVGVATGLTTGVQEAPSPSARQMNKRERFFTSNSPIF
jgi:hypothetical protein